MKQLSDTQALLEQWRDAPLAKHPEAEAPDHDARIRGIARALGSVAERKARRRWQRKQWLSVAFAAGVFGLAAAGWQLTQGPAAPQTVQAHAVVQVKHASPGAVWRRDHDGVRRAFAPELAAGDGLETGAGEAELGFQSGATAQLSKQSRVEVIRAAAHGEAFFLSAGAVEVEVPKLGSGQFSVQTPDALVVVHGTHFSVSIEPGPGAPHTRVDVNRGLVSVQSGEQEVWLGAGQHWPAEEPHAALDRPAPGPAALGPNARLPAAEGGEKEEPAAADQASHAANGEPPERSSKPVSSALREQNRHFARAMALKKSNEPEAALSELEQFERRYPRSVLRQEIRVEHFRLLARLGRAREAAREARAYLGDYPKGYAREEARDLALGAE